MMRFRRFSPNDIDVIDVGCGSGILSIAALKLGATHALAVDIDPEAVEAAPAERGAQPGVWSGSRSARGRCGKILEREFHDKPGAAGGGQHPGAGAGAPVRNGVGRAGRPGRLADPVRHPVGASRRCAGCRRAARFSIGDRAPVGGLGGAGGAARKVTLVTCLAWLKNLELC